MNHVLEIVIFRLKAGVSTDQFLAAAQVTFDLLQGYTGYLSRELAVAEDGLWTDVVHWDTLENAHKAADSFMATPEGQAFGNLIDFDTTVMTHATPKIVTPVRA